MSILPQSQTWIESLEETPQPNDVEINVFKATRGQATVSSQEDLNVKGETTSLFYHGSYEGNPFQTLYVSPEFYNLSQGKTEQEQIELSKKSALMQISPDMDPTDGVIDGLILLKQEDGIFSVYIFVDQDWKDKVGYTNILWGDDFRDPATLHTRQFNFTTQKNGIYTDKIEQDVDWFNESPVRGGVIVGEINLEVLNERLNEQEINQTFMYVR